jgi:peptidoglycan-associated lipoprotein
MSKGSFVVVMSLGVAVALSGLTGCASKKKMPAPEPQVTQPQPTQAPPKVEAAPRKEEAKPAPAPVVPEKIELRTIYFDYDQSVIRPDQTGTISQNAEILSRNRSVRVLIEGHCDERGTNEYNLALGQRRADSAKNYLVNYGIDSSRIETISYGEERPASQGQSEGAWAQNRRCEFVILSR